MAIENTMEYQGFLARIEYSTKVNSLIGRVLSVNSIPAFTAQSVSEMELLFHQVVDQYLADCQKTGQLAGTSYKGVITVRIPPALHRVLALQAAATDRSLNKVVIEALSEYAERHFLPGGDTDTPGKKELEEDLEL